MTPHHHLGLFFVAIATLSFFTNPILTISARSTPNPSMSFMQSHGTWEAFQTFLGCRPGQTQKGLSTIKNYFHRFGYIPDTPPTNFTDNFDETLVFAIRSYQKNYSLKITGELDDNTLQHMMQPRCGVPDIIHPKKRNFSTTADGNKSSVGNHKVHFHTVSDYAFFKGSPRWPAGTQQLTYAFEPQNQLNDNSKGAFARAFNRWNPVVKIAFQETTSYAMANIKIGFYRRDHGDGSPFDGPGKVLAHAFTPTDGRFHLDIDEYWVASGDVTRSQVDLAFDLESVAVHEIGHLLGLDHSSDQNAIMFSSIRPRTRKVDLTSDDIQGIQALYGIS